MSDGREVTPCCRFLMQPRRHTRYIYSVLTYCNNIMPPGRAVERKRKAGPPGLAEMPNRNSVKLNMVPLPESDPRRANHHRAVQGYSGLQTVQTL